MKGENLSDVRHDTVLHGGGGLCIRSNEFGDRSREEPRSLKQVELH